MRPYGRFPQSPEHFLDPSHPSVSASPTAFPNYTSPLFTLRTYPFTVMRPYHAETYPFKQPVVDLSDPVFRNTSNSTPIALLSILGKKRVHASAVVRNRIKARMKEALRLVVVRGAGVDVDRRLTMDDSEVGESHWLLQSVFLIPCLMDSPTVDV